VRYFANPCGQAVKDAMLAGLLGLIDTPHQGRTKQTRELREAGVEWCADNGAFTDAWVEGAWWAWLQLHAGHASTCRFAAAPDVVGDAAATAVRSGPWLPRIRDLGYPVAYVGQDGFDRHPAPWDQIDVLFIGGTDAWKLGPGAKAAIEQAHDHGVEVHMGRVNSQKRFTAARHLGCSSVDGTFLTRGPDKNLPQLLGWLRSLDQGDLLPAAVAQDGEQ
jgi:hypothetical protein